MQNNIWEEFQDFKSPWRLPDALPATRRLFLGIQQHLEKLSLPLQGEILDYYVLYLEQKAGKPSPNDSERRKSLASALEKAAAMNPCAEVDPAAQAIHPGIG